MLAATLLLICFTGQQTVLGQTKGLIVKPATGAGALVLDPDKDGYISRQVNNKQIGFQTNDYNVTDAINESEILYRPLPLPESEPMNDLARGPGGGFSDFADMNGTVYPVASILKDGNLMFRFRLGGIAPNSKGYSILVDADNKFGFSGSTADPEATVDNPGFEFEILLATNFAVRVYNVNNNTGTATALTTDADFPYAQYCQKAIAYTTNSGNADYFYDFYIPFASLKAKLAAAGITGPNGAVIDESTGLRMVANTIMAPQSAIKGPISDIGGLNDANYSNSAAAWSKIVSGFVPTAASGTTTTSYPAVRSVAPVITSTLIAGTGTVSGTSSEAVGTTIKVYKNSILLGTTTVVSGGTWTYPATGTTTLTLNDRFTATATATSKSESDLSNEVIVQNTCTYSTTPTLDPADCTKTWGINGTVTGASSGTDVKIYNVLNLTTPVATVQTGGTNNSNVANAFIYKENASYNNCNSGPAMTSGSYFATTNLGGTCESAASELKCIGTTTTSAHTLDQTSITQKTTQLTGTITSGTGTKVLIFIGGVYTAQTTVSSGTVWSVSNLVFRTGQKVDVYAVSGTNCAYAISTSVTSPTATPVVNSPLNVNSTSITGTSSEAAGTEITVYKNGASIGTATVTAAGTWELKNVSGLVAGNTITATALASYKTVSATSNTVTVAAAPAAVPTTLPVITGSYKEGGTSVTGTAGANATVNVYIDGYLLGTVTATSGGAWTLSGLSAANYDLYAGGILTATAGTIGSNETAKSTGVVVACNPPTVKTATKVTSQVCTGSSAEFRIEGSQSGVIYTLMNNSTERGPSVLGTGDASPAYVSVTSFALTNTTTAQTSETFTIIAKSVYATSCTTPNMTMPADASVLVNPAPLTDRTVTAPATVPTNNTAEIVVKSPQVGFVYQLRKGSTLIGSSKIAGNTSDLTFTTDNISAQTIYNVLVTDPTKTTNCTAQLIQTAKIGINDNSLPVELVTFTGKFEKDGVLLEWATATEKNNDNFQVERSRNGKDFETIGKVKGHINSSTLQTYSFLDLNAPASLVYYRLKQIDLDGKFEYSKVIVLDKKASVNQDSPVIYPNPTTGNSAIVLNSTKSQQATILIYDAVGNLVRNQASQTLKAGQAILNVQTEDLPAGMYFIKVIGENVQANLKLRKLNN